MTALSFSCRDNCQLEVHEKDSFFREKRLSSVQSHESAPSTIVHTQAQRMSKLQNQGDAQHVLQCFASPLVKGCTATIFVISNIRDGRGAAERVEVRRVGAPAFETHDLHFHPIPP